MSKMVDPEAHTLEVHRREGAGYYTPLGTHSGRVCVRVEPFEAVELELAFLWGEG